MQRYRKPGPSEILDTVMSRPGEEECDSGWRMWVMEHAAPEDLRRVREIAARHSDFNVASAVFRKSA